ncbi:HYR domain-containing protein, partial [bacterium]|nr:HYR domain-containing protein [bacterium]
MVGAGDEFSGAISYSFLSSGFTQTLSGTFTIDVSADGVFVRFQGKGQGGSLTCTLSNLNWNHTGQVSSLGSPVNTGAINGVAAHFTPTFTETSVTVGFTPFGFQPGLNMTQQVDINAGTAPEFTLNSPEGCAVAPNGDIYISDNASGDEKILVFDSNGNFVSQFGATGSGPGQLDDPRGIVVAPNGEILVIENDNRRVQVFSAAGTSLLTFGTADDTAPYSDGSFDDPLDLSLLANGDIAVVDEDRDDVQIFEGKAAWASAIVDTTDPVIICSPNLIVSNTAGQCGTTVNYSATATDDTDSAPLLSCNPPSGSVFSVGTTVVTCSATDASGNQSMCSFTITVNDTELPTIACPNNIIVSNDPGNCGALVSYLDPSGIDNCPGSITSQSNGLGSGAFFPIGTTTETFVVTDASGNQSSCSFTITVNDTELPTIACPNNVIVSNDPGDCGALVTYVIPSGTDNCPGTVTMQTNGLGSGAFFPVGTTTETFMVTDAAGNQTSCSFSISVNDTELPILTCPLFVEVDAQSPSGAIVDFVVMASDNCTPVPSLTTVPSSGSLFPIGETTVISTAIDSATNQSVCTFIVKVLSPAEMTENLVQSVNNLDIPTGTKNSLLSQLGNALEKIQNGNINGAVGSLNGLINHALAQRGKKLSAEEADSIIAAAQSILSALPAQQAKASNKGKKKSVGTSIGKYKITRGHERQVVIEWEQGVLESAISLSGPWLHLP